MMIWYYNTANQLNDPWGELETLSLFIYSLLAVSETSNQAVSTFKVKAAVLELKVITSQAVLQQDTSDKYHIARKGTLIHERNFLFFFFN